MKLHCGDISHSPYNYKTKMVAYLFESTVKLKKEKPEKHKNIVFLNVC